MRSRRSTRSRSAASVKSHRHHEEDEEADEEDEEEDEEEASASDDGARGHGAAEPADEEEEEEEEGDQVVGSKAVAGGLSAVVTGKDEGKKKTKKGRGKGRKRAEAHSEVTDEKVVAERIRQLAAAKVIARKLVVREAIGLVLVPTVILVFGLAALPDALNTATYQIQVAGSGMRSVYFGQLVNCAYQLIFNHSLAASLRQIEFGLPLAEQQEWMATDPSYLMVQGNRTAIRLRAIDALNSLLAVHRTLSYGGVLAGQKLPASLGSPSIDPLWFNTHQCWLYDEAECVAGRLQGVPTNASLINLFNGMMQAVWRMISYEDVALARTTPEFLQIRSLYDYDLRDGLDRVTMMFRFGLVAALSSQETLTLALFLVCLAAVLLSFFFLLKPRLVRDEMEKTAMMRAFLPAAAFGTATASNVHVEPLNVKSLDALHETVIQDRSALAQAMATSRPIHEVATLADSLYQATQQCFEAEQSLMRTHRLAHRHDHTQDHLRILAAYAEAVGALRAARPEAMGLVGMFLKKNLFLDHRAKYDQPMARVLNKRGVF